MSGLIPPLKALTLPQLRTPPHQHPTARCRLVGARLFLGGDSPKRRRGEEPRAPSHSLQSQWPGAVGRGGGGEWRRARGLLERLFGGFEGLGGKEKGELGRLNTKEAEEGRRAGQGGASSACRKGSLWVLAAVPEECREFICARHSPGLDWTRRATGLEPQSRSPDPGPEAPRSLRPWRCPKGTEDPLSPTGLVFQVSQRYPLAIQLLLKRRPS